MPILKNAEKALRQSKKLAERNADAKAKIAFTRRSIRKFIEAKKPAEASKLMVDLGQMLDKAVTKNLMKRNAVDRIKSRTQIAINKAGK